MRPEAVLIYDCFLADYAVVAQALAAMGHELVVNETALAAALRRLGVAFTPFDHFRTPEADAAVAKALRAVVAGLCAALHDPAALEAFTARGRRVLTVDFLVQFLRNAGSQLQVRHTARELLARRRLGVGVFGVDCYGRGATLVDTLRAAGRPTLQVMHGDFYGSPYQTAGFRRLISDYLAVFGENSRQELLRAGFARPNEILLAGSVPWDINLHAARSLDRNTARDRLGLPRDKTVALLCTDYHEINHPPWFAALEENTRIMERMAGVLAEFGRDLVLLCRPHPAEASAPGLTDPLPARFEVYRAWLQGLGLHDVRLNLDDKAQAIVASDFTMVFGYSSMIGEIMLMERPALVFEMVPVADGAVVPARRGKLVVPTGGECATALRGLCADPAFRERVVARQREALAYHRHAPGQAVTRLSGLIHALARGRVPHRRLRDEPACQAASGQTAPVAARIDRATVLGGLSALKGRIRGGEATPATQARLGLLVALASESRSFADCREHYGAVLDQLAKDRPEAAVSRCAAVVAAGAELLGQAFALSGANARP
ncbi:hypothetical protein DFW101_3692 (plasmid) [Solidesulfovibrio carbinoliphilus subsp. oakridgensis]|uniref:Uncharacterized protein n=1 Tax=Solidesulfovibrio carbinoliphilus subsp. oakridgensis TaxID=694327 RepID=G7QE82_9BACT|nr:hypothetical protein [Solidesulfovibrio carbinoliphilus]EHJ45976.1 hypothetical protein DFW101_3692 [Solidesulfovibrio carbinoliphilus subsp. oakridgensis]